MEKFHLFLQTESKKANRAGLAFRGNGGAYLGAGGANSGAPMICL